MRINWPILVASFLVILFCDTERYHAVSSYWQDPTPTLVPPLVSFSALSSDQQVVLFWEVEENEVFSGFFVIRSLELEGEYLRISTFIPVHEKKNELSYTYTDSDLTNGTPYFYILEILSVDETSTFSIPLEALPQAPTATPTPSLTFTASATQTHTATITFTPTLTPTASPTASATSTYTSTPTSTHTSTPTPTKTSTPIPSSTPTVTPSPTSTQTITPTETITRTPPIVYRTPSLAPTKPFVTITIGPISGINPTPLASLTPSSTSSTPSAEQTLLAGSPQVAPTHIPRKPLASSTRSIFWLTLGFGGLISLLVLLGGLGIHLIVRQK